MKQALLLVFMILMVKAYGADSAEKLYTQDDFDKKVKEEIESKIQKIKKKSITQLTMELIEKDKRLEDSEEALKRREEQLKVGEKTLITKIAAFELKQKKILGCLDKNKSGLARRIKQMVDVISSMKPLKAAEVLSVQESKISVKILEQIDPGRASKIFNLMDKEVSARLQKQYLNMRQ